MEDLKYVISGAVEPRIVSFFEMVSQVAKYKTMNYAIMIAALVPIVADVEISFLTLEDAKDRVKGKKEVK